jgi:hypothetical protein
VALLKHNREDPTVPFEWVRPLRVIDFKARRAAVIVKTSSSWHGVTPIRCPPQERTFGVDKLTK